MNRNKILFSISFLVVLLSGLVVPGSQAQTTSPPGLLTYQGHLLDAAGEPVLDGTYPMAFSLWDAPTGGTLLWGPENHSVDTADGFFAVLLGDTLPVDAGDLPAETYLEISVSGEVLTPRQQLAAVAFALSSSEAVHAGDADLLDGQDGAYYRDWINLANVPPGFADGIDDDTVYTDTDALSAVAAAGYVTSTGVIEVISNTRSITVSVSYATEAGDADTLDGQDGAFYLDWANLNNVPVGFADGVDDDTTYNAGNQLSLVGTTFHVDETGLNADLFDGQDSAFYLDWANLNNVPVGFADGVDDDTIYTDADALSAVQTAGYVTETGVIEVISNTGTITVNVTYAAEAGEVAWENVTGVPAGLGDGDDDTTYTAGNQLALSGTTFNVVETGLNADTLDGQDGAYYRDWSNLTGVPAGLGDGVDNDTTYSAGNQLTLSGTTFNVVETGLNADTLDGQDGTYYRDWTNLTGVPAGLDDGVDNDTTYTAGTGLGLAGTTFSADTAYLQRRVNGSCAAGSSIQAINTDGTVICQSDVASSNAPLPDDIHTIYSDSMVGLMSSITIGTDGLPIISFYSQTWGDLLVAHCDDVTCASSTVTTLDTSGDVGKDTSIAIGADGLPIISYFDNTADDLKVAHCDDIACTAATLNTVDSAGSVGPMTSIAVGSDGLPVISYYDEGNQSLKVAHCGDAACSTASTNTIDVPSTGPIGWHSSIAIGVDGLPIIGYFDFGPDDLKVAHCDNVACSSATITTLDSSGWVGDYPSVAIGEDGLPVIAYQDADQNDVMVAHCDNLSCTSATLSLVDGAGTVFDIELAVGSDGLPVVAYRGRLTQDLHVAHCMDYACTGSTIVVTPGTDGVNYVAMTIGTDGNPIISYYDEYVDDQEVIHCSNTFCAPYFRRR